MILTCFRLLGRLEEGRAMITSFRFRRSSPQLCALSILNKESLFPSSLKERPKIQPEEEFLRPASDLDSKIELKRLDCKY